MAKTKMKFSKGSAKSAKNIKQNMSKGGGFGNMLWIKADSSKTVRIIAEPKDWIEYGYVGLENNADGDKMQFRKLPTYAGYEDDFAGSGALRVRTAYAIPVIEIDEDGKPGDRVMFYEPGQKLLDSLLNRFERRKSLTDCDVEIIREGSGKTTSYDLYWSDPKKRAKLIEKAEIPDIDEDLVRMVKEASAEFNKDGGEDEDDEPKSKKSKAKKSKASKKRAMVDEDEDDEEEADEPDEDEEEEADEDEDSEEESDDEEGDDEDDEEGDEEESELPTEDEVKAMEFKELKAFATENEVEVKNGSKSKGYRDAILAWLEEQSEGDEDGDEDEEGDEDEGDDEAGEERVEDTFTMTNIDTTAFTVDLEDSEGNEYETVYLDRERDKVGSYKNKAKYKLVIELDDQEDWVAVTSPAAVKKPAAKKGSAKAKAGKKSKK